MLCWQLPIGAQSIGVYSADKRLAEGVCQALVTWLTPVAPDACDARVQHRDNARQALVCVRWGDPLINKPYAVAWTDPSWDSWGRLTRLTVTVVEKPLIDQTLSLEQRADRFAATMLHEAGHLLGLDHVDDPHAVMYYQGWRNTCLTAADLRVLHAKYGQKRYVINR